MKFIKRLMPSENLLFDTIPTTTVYFNRDNAIPTIFYQFSLGERILISVFFTQYKANRSPGL